MRLPVSAFDLYRKCSAAKPAKVAKLNIFAPSRGLATLAPLAKFAFGRIDRFKLCSHLKRSS